MVKTASTMLELGTKAPGFSLPNVDGGVTSLEDFSGSPLLVMFLCNHCPFVKHLADHISETTQAWMSRGVKVVGISSNDTEAYPDDNFEAMKVESQTRGYSFPYLLDEDQRVAVSYRAACTPDFFLFDQDHRLVYRGQYDSSRPGNDIPVTGGDLAAAVAAVVVGEPVAEPQKPSIGCNIKWRPGNEPAYFLPNGIGG